MAVPVQIRGAACPRSSPVWSDLVSGAGGGDPVPPRGACCGVAPLLGGEGRQGSQLGAERCWEKEKKSKQT